MARRPTGRRPISSPIRPTATGLTSTSRVGPGRRAAGGVMRRDGGTERAAPVIGASGGEPEPAADTGAPPPAIDNRLFVLVLQHPQERSEPRATAAATVAALRRARLVVGLSWPNLTRALGTGRPADPRHWGVLYLGSAQPRSLTWGSRPRESPR